VSPKYVGPLADAEGYPFRQERRDGRGCKGKELPVNERLNLGTRQHLLVEGRIVPADKRDTNEDQEHYQRDEAHEHPVWQILGEKNLARC
jgi:hypothetical protein